MQLPSFDVASVTFEEMEEVNQKSKNTKADHDTLKRSQMWKAEVCVCTWEIGPSLSLKYLAWKKWKLNCHQIFSMIAVS